VADAAARGAAQGARLPGGRHSERHAGAEWRDAGRRFVPAGIRARRCALGAPGHRRARVPRGRALRVYPRRAERAQPSAASSRSRWTSRTGACRQQDSEGNSSWRTRTATTL
jgi:hypothetical protein